MDISNTSLKKINYLFLSFCLLSFSISYSQIDFSKEVNNKKFKGSILSSKKQGDYLEESKIPVEKKDTITFLYNVENIAKFISVKNGEQGISNDQFHIYAKEMNPKFRFHSKKENDNVIVYFNEEKNFANIKVYSEHNKNKLVEIVFISGIIMIQKVLLNR